MSACLLYFLYLTFIKHYLLITQWTFFVFSFLPSSSSSFFQLLNSFIINIYPETINRINVNLISLFPLKKKKNNCCKFEENFFLKNEHVKTDWIKGLSSSQRRSIYLFMPVYGLATLQRSLINWVTARLYMTSI